MMILRKMHRSDFLKYSSLNRSLPSPLFAGVDECAGLEMSRLDKDWGAQSVQIEVTGSQYLNLKSILLDFEDGSSFYCKLDMEVDSVGFVRQTETLECAITIKY